MGLFLLSYRWKLVGCFLSVSGIILAVLYLWFNVHFNMPVFAIFSSYLENKLFVTFTTNVTDDLILLLLVSGFTLIVFSREKNEVENSDNLRFLAVGKALIWNTLFLILSILFVFGSGFIVVLVVNLFSLPLLYLLFFHRLRYLALKSKKGISSHELNYDEGHQKRDN